MKIDKNYKSIAMQAVGITGGQIAANAAGKAIDKLGFIPENLKPYAKGGIQAIAGIVIASKGKGKSGALISSAGVGMAAQGFKTILGTIIPSLVSGVSGSPSAEQYIDYETVGSTANAFSTTAATLGGFEGSTYAGSNGTFN